MAPDDQSPAEPMPEPALLALARKHFGALSFAEEELFRAAQEGKPTSVLTGDNEKNNPADAANWPAERIVCAECIAWVCTDPQASSLMTHRGLHLRGMRIDGELDLANAEIKFYVRAEQCAFSGNISLQDAQLRGFDLANCQTKSLDASRATVSGSVFLRNGFKAEGEVSLMGIRIGGDLSCHGAQFSSVNGFALSAKEAKIEGSVFLTDGFEAKGKVMLLGIEIGGDLVCHHAQFSNPQGSALDANGAQLKGSVFLRDSKVEGEVNLVGATIGGGLSCDGTQILNARRFALNVCGAQITGYVFLLNGFKADREVNFVGATIAGLDCGGGQFLNAKGCALNAEGAKIEGHTFLRQGFQVQGRVNLLGATIGSLQIFGDFEIDKLILDLRLAKVETFWDEEWSWPEAGNLFLDGFRYERLFEYAPFEADKRKKWLSLQPQDRFRPQPYEQLATVLRQMGHEGEARQIVIEKNRARARFTRFPRQSWWWYNFFGRFIGYGYAPWRAFASSVAMVLLGTVLFHFGSTHDLISPTSENAYAKAPNGQVIRENGQKKISEEFPAFNAFFYSLESFTPLLKLDQGANWRPNANRSTEISSLHWKMPTGSLLRYYLYVHIAAGWLLTSLWVGAITGLVKT